MQRERFSIVVPVYNRASLIGRTLDSIYAQTYRPLSLIVVDNASTDASASKVVEWAEKKASSDFSVTLVHDPVPGAAHARNTGLAEVKTRWMCFFDSDDCMRPSLVEEVMKNVQENPRLKIVTWSMMYTGIDGKKRLIPNRKGDSLINHIVHCTLSTDRFAVNTDYLRKCGCWNARLMGWDDWELGVRLLLDSPVMKTIPSPLVDYYAREDSLTGLDYSGRFGVWEEAIKYSSQAIEESRRDDRSRLYRMILFRKAALAGFYAYEGRPDLSENLIAEALNSRHLNSFRRKILKLVYDLHSKGVRGSWYLAYLFL